MYCKWYYWTKFRILKWDQWEQGCRGSVQSKCSDHILEMKKEVRMRWMGVWPKLLFWKGTGNAQITYVNNEGVKWYEKFQRDELGMRNFFANFIFDCQQSFRQHHWYTVATGGHRSQSDRSHIAGNVADEHKPQRDCSHIAGDAADGR